MKSPFFIKHQSQLDINFEDVSNKTILGEFEYRFKKLHCDKIAFLNESKILVKNELIRIPPDLNLNYWTGIGKAEIHISRVNHNKKTITYRYYFTRIIIGFAVLLTFLMSSIFIGEFPIESKFEAFKLLAPIFFGFFTIWFLTVIIRHKTVFNGVIRIIKNNVPSAHHSP